MSSLAISGRYLALAYEDQQKKRVAQLGKVVLGIHVVGEDAVIERYVRAKVAYGKRIGATVVIYRHTVDQTTEGALDSLRDSIAYCDGIIVQLPVPIHIDKDVLIESIPQTHDVDVLTNTVWKQFQKNETRLMPPVGRAVETALASLPVQSLMYREIHAVVIGFGALVGQPSAVVLDRMGCKVSVIDRDTPEADRMPLLASADIVVSGVGAPNLIQPFMVKKGVVLLDGGTSESGGSSVGDIALECRAKAQYFAEVPGGLGPLTVAGLFENLCILAEAKQKK
jgi:methylenetetrahydrofolate dehydrogenase (NADP+) / methenyltetrahydrofolate cyclohydrolase